VHAPAPLQLQCGIAVKGQGKHVLDILPRNAKIIKPRIVKSQQQFKFPALTPVPGPAHGSFSRQDDSPGQGKHETGGEIGILFGLHIAILLIMAGER
jgi:hypothetical protein